MAAGMMQRGGTPAGGQTLPYETQALRLLAELMEP